MNTMHRSIVRIRTAAAAGYSLVELVVAMGITTMIMGATMTAMTHAIQANQTALMLTGMNSSLRVAMDLMVRDLLQVGQGLPAGGVILTPSGANAVQLNLPGPPIQLSVPGGVSTTYRSVAGDTDISAVSPGPGLGQVVNGAATDMITTLAADSAFDHKSLSALAADGSSMTVSLAQPDPFAPICDISNGGPDDILPGQLILLTKGGTSALVQVTRVDGVQTVFFAASDSLKLNQPNAALGNITALLATAPADVLPAPQFPQFVPTQATRVRMISYYLDATTPSGAPASPRLIRRMNNGLGTGPATTFDNKLGTTVAFDVENLQITYDIADGVNNPSLVRMNAADVAGTGACAPNPCSVNQIRKVNVTLTGRSHVPLKASGQYVHNTLTSQVSLRSLSFVDRYR